MLELASLHTWIPLLVVTAGALLFLRLAHWLLLRPSLNHSIDSRLPRQLLMLAFTALALLFVLITFPLKDSLRGQLLSFLGVILTALIALSSSTFVANMMAGLMLRMLGSFRPGDFVRVKGMMGRVSERGLIHTEIQTEERDLTTFPNLYLVTQPLTVIRSSGTVVKAFVSLGYDVPRALVEQQLLAAAEASGLRDPFVQITELGDFSITYRIAGLLDQVKTLFSAKSRLHACMLDALHDANVEIVSPAFMNQRPLNPEKAVIPCKTFATPTPSPGSDAPEDLIFDKADQAENLVELDARLSQTRERLTELRKEAKSAEEDEKAKLERKIERIELALEHMMARRQEFQQGLDHTE